MKRARLGRSSKGVRDARRSLLSRMPPVHKADYGPPLLTGEHVPEAAPLLIIAGQPVIRLELNPEERCVELELAPTPKSSHVLAKFYEKETLIEITPETRLELGARLHLVYFRVALDERYDVISYEVGAVKPPDKQVTLRKTREGDFEVSGPVFARGTMDLAVGVSRDRKLVKTAIWSRRGYVDIELQNTEEIKAEAERWAAQLWSLMRDEMRGLDFGAFAEEAKSVPDVGRLMAQLGWRPEEKGMI